MLQIRQLKINKSKEQNLTLLLTQRSTYQDMIYMYSVPLLAQLNDKVSNSLKAIFSFPSASQALINSVTICRLS